MNVEERTAREPFLRFTLRSLLLSIPIVSFYLAIIVHETRTEPLSYQIRILGIPVCYVVGFVSAYYLLFVRRRSREKLAGQCLITLDTTFKRWSVWFTAAMFTLMLTFVGFMFSIVLSIDSPRMVPFLNNQGLGSVSLAMWGFLYFKLVLAGYLLALFWPVASHRAGIEYCDLREYGVLQGIWFGPWNKVRGYEWLPKRSDRLIIRLSFWRKINLVVPVESRKQVEEILEQYLTEK